MKNIDNLPLDILFFLSDKLYNFIDVVNFSKTCSYLQNILEHIHTIKPSNFKKSLLLNNIYDKKICITSKRSIIYPEMKRNEKFGFQIGTISNPLIINNISQLNLLVQMDTKIQAMLYEFANKIEHIMNMKNVALKNPLFWTELSYDCNFFHGNTKITYMNLLQLFKLQKEEQKKRLRCICIIEIMLNKTYMKFITHDIMILK